MSTSPKCPVCNADLEDGLLGGLCPRCVTRVAFGNPADEAAELPAADAAAADSPSGTATIRRFGDYELLAEIGRGGMGIVYKARQASLDRIVAVKMILPAPFASEECIQRFRAEAQTAASLRHPNIVAIHEVGVHESQHYFTMDYVQGPSLAEAVRGGPLAPARAARYIRIIAEAIHFAHQQGVLHRDLKPSNAVIDPFDQPRITDFGLAKRMTAHLDLTLTGQVLGSPHYLPPEQAAGRTKEATPASDVYSLGAILYYLLIGRPPFQGETLATVLEQVIKQPPPKLRSLNSGIPHDLEIICLKCLGKEPEVRYSSAEALADDLRRWEAGEPIQAHPIRAVERMARWSRRHPIAAGLLAATIAATLVLTSCSLWHQLQLWRLQNAGGLFYVWLASNEFYLCDSDLTRWKPIRVQGQALDISPDGKRLCCSRTEGSVHALYVTELDGTSPRRVMDNAANFRWLDNHTILYEPPNAVSVMSLDLLTGAKRQLFEWKAVTSDGVHGGLILSPDHTRLVSQPQNRVRAQTADIFICDLQGQNVQAVWEDADNNTGDGGPLWLAEDRIVWVRNARSGPESFDSGIVLCRVGDTNFHALTDWTGRKQLLAVSPDGGKILFWERAAPDTPLELRIMNSDGSNPRKIFERNIPVDRTSFGARWFRRPDSK